MTLHESVRKQIINEKYFADKEKTVRNQLEDTGYDEPYLGIQSLLMFAWEFEETLKRHSYKTDNEK